jgi:hypothetical protein
MCLGVDGLELGNLPAQPGLHGPSRVRYVLNHSEEPDAGRLRAFRGLGQVWMCETNLTLLIKVHLEEKLAGWRQSATNW